MVLNNVLTVALSAFVMAGSAMTLVGWTLGVRRLTAWFDLDISQLPNNAVGVFAGGAATLLWRLATAGPAPCSL